MQKRVSPDKLRKTARFHTLTPRELLMEIPLYLSLSLQGIQKEKTDNLIEMILATFRVGYAFKLERILSLLMAF